MYVPIREGPALFWRMKRWALSAPVGKPSIHALFQGIWAGKARHFWVGPFFIKHLKSNVVFCLHLALEVFVFVGEIHIKKILLHFL